MQGNQNPRNSPPALPIDWQSVQTPGRVHGLQSSETWAVGESDNRQLCDQTLAAALWRLSVFGSSNMSYNLIFGSSRAKDLKGLRGPIQICVPGQVALYAQPLQTGQGIFVGGFAMVTCTPVSSAAGDASNARYLMLVAGPLPPEAARFRATENSVVRLEGATNCALTAGQWIPLVAGSSLTSGAGFVEFEP